MKNICIYFIKTITHYFGDIVGERQISISKNTWMELGDLKRPRSWYPSLAILNRRLSCVGGKVTPFFEDDKGYFLVIYS